MAGCAFVGCGFDELALTVCIIRTYLHTVLIDITRRNQALQRINPVQLMVPRLTGNTVPVLWATALITRRVTHLACPRRRVLVTIRKVSPAVENTHSIWSIYITPLR